jgi:hypothetical protein
MSQRLESSIADTLFLYLTYGAIWVFGLRLCGHNPLLGSVIDVSLIEAPISLVEAPSTSIIGN